MSRRIMTTEHLEEDVRIENHLRPQLLEDYIGQAKAKEMLKINIEAARIIEYVASNVGRFRIKDASNILKGDATIDGHIRAQLS